MSGRPAAQRELRTLRGAFTLIEVLLSLGLAALVLVALATAVDVHLRCLQIGRTHAEEAQLARALLFRIEDDLRNVAVINPVDSEQIPPAPSGGGENPGTTAPGSSSESESGTETFETLTDTEEEYLIGLYGESDWMQVDVRRAPRLDQYGYETLPGGSEVLPDRVSGLKTVYYALATDTGLTSGTGEYEGGLVRREIDRAVTRWADEMGTLASVDQELEPIAPEVTDIEFLYHDGSEWVESWDSTEMGGLPIAVHVSMAIMPREQFNRFAETWREGSAATEETVNFIYSLTVALPVAEGGLSSETTSTDSETETEGEGSGGEDAS